MGREIRRVPPNWEHPKGEKGNYLAMYDDDFDSALQEWLKEYELWKAGKHPYQDTCPFWHEISSPPNPEAYRPAFAEEPTWYQVYETVSEGTPVTPPFATKGELVDYLVEHGDFWDQRRKEGGWQREYAERFAKQEWAPSMILSIFSDSIEAKFPRNGA